MTDDVARDPAEIPGVTGPGEDRPKRSRRRGKRSRSRSAEGQIASEQTATESGERVAGESPKAAPPRGGRKSGTHTNGYIPYGDGLDRFVCLDCFRLLPLTYPVQHRRGIATLPLREVDRRDGEILLCNGLHEGPCLWPDGTIVEPQHTPADPEASRRNGRDDLNGASEEATVEQESLADLAEESAPENADDFVMKPAESP